MILRFLNIVLIFRELLGQHLDGYFTAQVGVFSSIDLSHATLAYLLDDFVMANGLADHACLPRLSEMTFCRW